MGETSPLKGFVFAPVHLGWLDLSYLFNWCGISPPRAEAKKEISSPAKAMDNIMQPCSHSASEPKYKGIIYCPGLSSSAKEEYISAFPLFPFPWGPLIALSFWDISTSEMHASPEPMDPLVP